MHERMLDLQKSVYQLCAENPGLPEVLAEAGFRDITRPGMLTTAGRLMTLPKGARMKGIALSEIEALLLRHGYRTTKGEHT